MEGGGRERRDGGGRERRVGGHTQHGGSTSSDMSDVSGDKSHQATDARRPVKHKGGGAYRLAKPSKSGGGGMPVHYVVLPALLLGGVAMLVYVGERWLFGLAVNKPLPLPPAVSDEWRKDDVYLTRLWGTYR